MSGPKLYKMCVCVYIFQQGEEGGGGGDGAGGGEDSSLNKLI